MKRGCKESAREKTGEEGEAGESWERDGNRRGEWFARWEKQETRAVQAGQPARRYRRSRYHGDSTFFCLSILPSSRSARREFSFARLIKHGHARRCFFSSHGGPRNRHTLYLEH